MTKHIEIRIPDGTPRTRLEEFLFGCFPNLSRMYLRETVRDARCQVNGRHENVGFRVRGGDFVEIELDPSRQTAMRPEDIRLDIIFEDAHLLVVNKPAGMLVHPTHREKTGTLLNALAFYLNAASAGTPHSAFNTPHSAFIRPGLVHRLDKQTSGLMVVAKSVSIHQKLAKQFQKKRVEKKYHALVEGVIESDEGVIEGNIGRYAEEKRWAIKADGKSSVTRFKTVKRNAASTMLELEPVTGRTNQLRIHLASIGHPIVGDVARGGRPFERLCLHAYRLAFDHPIEGHRVVCEVGAPIESDPDRIGHEID